MPSPLQTLFALEDTDDTLVSVEDWDENRSYGTRIEEVITDEINRQQELEGADKVEVFDDTVNAIKRNV